MRKLLLPILVLTLGAADHMDHLKLILAKSSSHGKPIPQPSVVAPNATVRVFNITARAFQFDITPSPFVVDEGEIVTLNVSVPAVDSSPSGHGILMDTYIENAVNIAKGQSREIQFTATTPGTFAFVCTQSNCGIGHSVMFGQLVVAAPTVSSVSPSVGRTAGGTLITITGSGFHLGATVTVGGTAATGVNVVSSSTITAMTPPRALGAAEVVVMTVNGAIARKAAAFTYSDAPPRRRSVRH